MALSEGNKRFRAMTCQDAETKKNVFETRETPSHTRIVNGIVLKGKAKCQTILRIDNLWQLAFQYLKFWDHIECLLVCTEWYVYGMSDSSWCPRLKIRIRDPHWYIKWTRVLPEHVNDSLEYVERKEDLYQMEHCNTSMFNQHTRYIDFGANFVQREKGSKPPVLEYMWQQVVTKCTGLRKIQVHSCMGKLTNDRFKQLVQFKRLEKFTWSGIDWPIKDYNLISEMKNLKEVPHVLGWTVLLPQNIHLCSALSLTSLHYERHCWRDAPRLNPLDLLLLKGSYATLTKLAFNGHDIAQYSLKDILAPFRNLTDLDMDYTTLRTECMINLCTMGLPLTSLTMNHCREIEPYGYHHLGKLNLLTSLKLRGCKIDDTCAEQFKHLAKLKTLDLGVTDVGNRVCRSIGTLLQLDSINLSQTRVTIDGIWSVAFLPILYHLYADENGLFTDLDREINKRRKKEHGLTHIPITTFHDIIRNG